MSDKKNIDQFKSLHCCEKESARLIEQTKHGVLLPTKLWNRTTSESPLSISTLNGLSKSTVDFKHLVKRCLAANFGT